ncbi:hypothetical protein RIF29_18567 [Crotalaria pallida]|uniref:Uncharacterized protein n=1 Tax=Crotalaria pallida TaxID=3830 RepID=A0AAN9FK33_CROPI
MCFENKKGREVGVQVQGRRLGVGKGVIGVCTVPLRENAKIKKQLLLPVYRDLIWIACLTMTENQIQNVFLLLLFSLSIAICQFPMRFDALLEPPHPHLSLTSDFGDFLLAFAGGISVIIAAANGNINNK